MRSVLIATAVASLVSLPVARGGAQEIQVAMAEESRGPRFLLESGRARVPLDVSRTTPLRRRVSLAEPGLPLARAIDAISRQAGITIVYSDDVVPVGTRLRVRLDSITVAAALTELLIDTNLDVVFRPDGSAALVPRPRAAAPAAVGVLTGLVTARDDSAGVGAAIGAAIVSVAGTSLLTQTNDQGRYTLAGVPAGTQRVQVRRLGFAPLDTPVVVRDGATTTLDVRLARSAVRLEQTVVLGYSTQSQREVVSSVTQVNAEQLRDVTTSGVTRMLQGKAPGVFVTGGSGDPSSTPEIRVRGTGSITADAGPLMVVDGVIGGQADPADVATVTVLKDAAATALYGSRAANGVIVITTKSGQRGATRSRLNAASGLTKINNGNFDLLNARELYDFLRSMNVTAYGGRTLGEDLLQHDTDWLGLAFRDARVSQLDASVAGGDARATYYVSGNYFGEQGAIDVTGFRRYGGRVNADFKVTDRLTVTTRLAGRVSDDRNDAAGSTSAYVMVPFDYPYNADGTVRRGNEADWLGRDNSSFLYPRQYNTSNSMSRTLSGDLKLAQQFTSWLSLTSTNRYESADADGRVYNDPRTTSGSVLNGELSNSFSNSRTLLTSNLLHLDRALGENHRLRGIAGVEYQGSENKSFNATGASIFPGLGILDVTATANDVGGTSSERAFVSALSQADYGYRDTYFANVSFRRDGSSVFGRDNRYGNFYSVGGAWLVSNQGFLQGLSAVDELKLRASYGTAGNADIGAYQARALYSFATTYAGLAAAVPSRLPNPNLTWEVARVANVGMDLRLFERFTVTLDAYRRVNDDLLLDVTLPGTSGIASITRNIGSVENRGLELALSATVGGGRWPTWTSDFNVGFNRNRVLALNQGQPIPNGNQRIEVGHDINSWYLRKWVGVDPANGDPLWERVTFGADSTVTARTTTNVYNDATLQRVGTSSPDYTGGWQNILRYRNLSLAASLNFVSGNLIYHSGRETFDSDGTYIDYQYMKLPSGWSRWTKPGDQATHPKAVVGGNRNANRPSSRYLEDGSYVRLTNVTLAYTLPQTLRQRVGASSARIYATGDNVLTRTDFSGIEPQVGLGGTAGAPFPLPRKFLLGLDVGF
jgi:TonB-linked SusC/RagA family outer membrane protein